MRHYMLDDDEQFHLAGIRAYNDWMAKEFMKPDAKRLIGLAQIPNLGVEHAIEEMRRTHRMGMRGVILSAWPAGAASISKEDDAFWQVAQELDLPVSIHLGTVSKAAATKPGTSTGKFEPTGLLTAGQKTVASYSTAGMDSMPPIISETILSGLFDRFPRLRFVSVEAGAGWVPYLLEQMDDRWWRNRHWAKVERLLPAQLALDVRQGLLRRPESACRGHRQHDVVHRLSASHLRLALFAEDRQRDVCRSSRERASSDLRRERRTALPLGLRRDG
jgi:predicted TIM-barrel fold metal-dependent hydrolase